MRSSGLLAVSLFSLVAACGTDDPSDEPVDCTKVTGTDTFVVGLDKPGDSGVLDFQMMSADPAPPARDDNTWIVQINSMQSGVVGAPIDGATLAVTPFMPAHQHGSPIRVQITPVAGQPGQYSLSPVNLWMPGVWETVQITPVAGQPGQYSLSPVNLWMPGVWETTIKATSGDTSDTAIYRFCIN